MSTRTTRTLVVTIQDYWITATGRGGVHDAATRTDAAGLPFLPGRHLRGLLRDAMETLASFRNDPKVQDVQALFGTKEAHDENRPGLIEFRDARLPPAIAERLAADARLRGALFDVLRVTAIEDGVARDRSLRNMKVAVPMVLQGEIALREEALDHPLAQRWEGMVERALPLVMAVGAHRQRGLGRAWLRLAP